MLTKTLTAVIFTGLLAGCSGGFKEDNTNKQRVAIALARHNDEPAPAGFRSQVVSESVGTGMKVGAATGAVLALTGSAACGPFVIVCGPAALALAGVTAGTIGGGLAGGLAGAGSNAGKQSEKLHDAITALNQRHKFDEELLSVVTNAIGPHAEVTNAAPDLILTIELERIDLTRHRDQLMSLTLDAALIIEDKNGATRRRTYHYASEPYPINAWIERSNLMEQEIDWGYGVIAEKVITDLWY